MADKIIYWKKEVEKVTKPIEKKLGTLFKSHRKKCEQKNLKTIAEINKLWNDKYKNKYEKYDKQLDEAYKKLWLKYRVSLSSTKSKTLYLKLWQIKLFIGKKRLKRLQNLLKKNLELYLKVIEKNVSKRI